MCSLTFPPLLRNPLLNAQGFKHPAKSRQSFQPVVRVRVRVGVSDLALGKAEWRSFHPVVRVRVRVRVSGLALGEAEWRSFHPVHARMCMGACVGACAHAHRARTSRTHIAHAHRARTSRTNIAHAHVRRCVCVCIRAVTRPHAR